MKLSTGIRKIAALLVGLVAASQWAGAEGLTPKEQLGKHLFFDNISDPSWVSCVTCHRPDQGWTGVVAGINVHGGVYRGAVPQRFGNRKPPSSAYAAFSPIFSYNDILAEFIGGNFWDGRATGERLGNPAADQALGPFLNPVEQNMPSKAAVVDHVAVSNYAGLFEEVWGPGSLEYSNESEVEAVYDQIGLSIAAYEASAEVSQFTSKFDAYWHSSIMAGNDPADVGLAQGEKEVLDPLNILTEQEFDGLVEFGEYCSACHVSHEPGPDMLPPLFTDFTFANIGVPRNPENPFYAMDRVLLEDGTPINPLGAAFVDFGLGDFLRTRPEWEDMAFDSDGKFKVPTVRNVDKRNGQGFAKAYTHNGVFKSLKEVVHFYNTRDVPEEGWPPPEVDRNVNREILAGVPLGNLELDEQAEDAIVAFLKTLSDGYLQKTKVKKPKP